MSVIGIEHRLSGRLGYGAISLPLVGLAAAIAVGCVYGFASRLNPLLGSYAVILIVVTAGLMGVICLLLVRILKCRNPFFAVVRSSICALATLYAARIAYVPLALRRPGRIGLDNVQMTEIVSPAAFGP